ncbi:MAG: PAS domain S-box protein, partial [Rhizobium sp.]|nr:PAS domain S-box protein [Rhizobium sp.]
MPSNKLQNAFCLLGDWQSRKQASGGSAGGDFLSGRRAIRCKQKSCQMTAMPDYSKIFDLLDDCMIVYDLDGRVTDWNRAAENLYGVLRDQAINASMDDLFGPLSSDAGSKGQAGHVPDWKGTLERPVRGRSGSTTVSVTSKILRNADGEPVAIVETSRPVAVVEDPSADLAGMLDAAGMAILRVDATEAFQALTRLRSQVPDLRDHLRREPDLVHQLMLSTKIEDWGPSGKERSSHSKSDLSVGGLSTLWPQQSADVFIDIVVSVLLDGVSAHTSCKLLDRNGATFDADITALPTSSATDAAHLLLAIRDVSAAREAYETLEASELRYRNLFEYMPIALTQLDASGLVEMFTQLRRQGVEDLSTYIDEHPEFMDMAMQVMRIEQVNQTNADLFAAKSRDEMRGPITPYFWDTGRETLRKALEARYRGEDFFQQEAQLLRLDGSLVDVLFAASRHSSLPDKSLVAFMDISDRKQAEQALRRSERRYQDLFLAMTVSFWELDLTTINDLLETSRPGADGDFADYLKDHPDCVATILKASRIVDVNDQTLALFGGAEKSELLGTLDQFWSPDRWVDGAAAVLTVLTDDASVTIETRLR